MAASVADMTLSTLMPVLLGVTLTRFIVTGHYALHRTVYPGFRSFVAAEFFVLVGMASIALRSSFGDNVLTVFLTNLGTLLQPVLVYNGLASYGRIPRLAARTRQNLLFVGLAISAQLADVLLAPDITRRVLVYSVAAGLLYLRIAVELPLLNRRAQPGVTLLCATYLVSAVLQGARAWGIVPGVGYDFGVMLDADHLLAGFLFFRILQSVLEFYVLFSLNSAQLEDELRVATARIERMAQTDALTGALNRRGLELLGDEAVRRSARARRPCGVIMIDLDHFKQVNDSLGHEAGDRLLAAVARLCAGSLRFEDVFARFGGEEFVVVAPLTTGEEAAKLAERMRQAVESASFEGMGGRRVTASFGVASAIGWPLEALVKLADKNLYEAKQTGRNRVVLAEADGADELCEG